MPFRNAVRSLVLFIALSTVGLVDSALAQTVQREEAVKWAQAGELDRALERLHELRKMYPEDAQIGYDLSVILQWAGHPNEALAVFDAYSAATAPDYALFTAAQSARAAGAFEKAEWYLLLGTQRFPDQKRWDVLRSLVYVDAARPEDARRLLNQTFGEDPVDLDGLLALGYLHASAGEYPAALRFYTQALSGSPENSEAAKGRTMALAALGAPFYAEELADARPQSIDEAQRAYVAGNQMAVLLLWGQIPISDPRERFVKTDRAITALQQQIADLEMNPLPDSAAFHRACFDLIVAFHDRARMADAVRLYERLRREQIVVPAYSRLAAAAAYLYLEQPKVAREIYESVVAENVKDNEVRFEAHLGLFYAMVETEHFRGAYAEIDALDKSQPRFNAYQDGGADQSNDHKMGTAVAAALARFYGNQLKKAWDGISILAAAAPANTDLQINRATIAQSRGWPRRALGIIQPWLYRYPDNAGLTVANASNQFALRRYAEAGLAIARLSSDYPDNKGIQRLQQDWDVHKMAELEMAIKASQGGSADVPGFEFVGTGRLWSPPIANNWRATVSYRYNVSDLSEGREMFQRSGVGMDYRTTAWRGFGELTYNSSTQDQVGGRLEAEWTPDDYWTLYAMGEIFAQDSSTRALKNHVTANAFQTGARYRFNESREAGLSWRLTGFSDGNVRNEFFPRFQQRLVNRPRFDLDVLGDLYFAMNSRTDGPYFSPKTFFTPSFVLNGVHRTWRRYQHSFSQIFELGGGGAFQAGFTGRWTAVVAYRHEWNFGPRYNLSYGVLRASRVYDGNRERDLEGVLALRMRF